jgi:hypothetical protein
MRSVYLPVPSIGPPSNVEFARKAEHCIDVSLILIVLGRKDAASQTRN